MDGEERVGLGMERTLLHTRTAPRKGDMEAGCGATPRDGTRDMALAKRAGIRTVCALTEIAEP